MHFGTRENLELLGLLVALGTLLALAPTLRLPLPILLVLGGVALSFIPGLPPVALPPDVVLVAVLPPLLYSGAFFTSLANSPKASAEPVGAGTLRTPVGCVVGVGRMLRE